MEDMLFHMFFVSPMVRWLTSNERFWNGKKSHWGMILSIIFLLLVGFLQFHQVHTKSLYQVLGLSPTASHRDIQGAYRKLSLKYHPDKNDALDAQKTFDSIKEAQEILTNNKKRRAYHHFGDFSAKGEVDEEHFWDVFFVATLQAVIPFFFGYLYTYGSDSVLSRQIYVSFLGVSFSLDLLMRFSPEADSFLLSVPICREFLPFEKVKFMHGAIPLVLNGVLMLGGFAPSPAIEVYEGIARHCLDVNLQIVDKLDMFQDLFDTAQRRFLRRQRAIQTATDNRNAIASSSTGGSRRSSTSSRAMGDAFNDGVSQVKGQEGMRRRRHSGARRAGENLEVALEPSQIVLFHDVEGKETAAKALEENDVWQTCINGVKAELPAEPRGFSMAGVVGPQELSPEAFAVKSMKLEELLEETDDSGSGSPVTVGSVVFFGLMFFRWISGK
eukprot:GHVT01020393.1.p1 GENE.GHVT01020393.1~~GHVT01020393.1.p1  ORF type:complete len:442 (+),score=57.96 GHVT01020393.1:1496-2821(+)